MNWNIATINIAKAKYNLESAEMLGFTSQLAHVNKIADSTTGFVWRLVDGDGDGATNIRLWDDPKIVVNMSVWLSIGALKDFTYRSFHGQVYKKRLEWFEKSTQPMMANWWVPSGYIPPAEEGKARLEYLQKNGVSCWAFDFKNTFDPM